MSEPKGVLAQSGEVTLEDVRRARVAIGGAVHRTPIIPAPSFPGIPPTTIYLKLENLQTTGAFKLRGATNRIAHLTAEQARRGVIAASAGNHAQGVAFAAKARGIPATVVMATTASPLKVSSTRALGAEVILRGVDYEEAFQEAVRLSQETGQTLVHPFDDPWVIAGQGTVGLEIMEEVPDVRRIIVGVGGGGLLAGIAVAARGLRPQVELVGVQPVGSSTLVKSMEAGRVIEGPPPSTFADGLATRSVGKLTLELLRKFETRPVVVDDRTIARAIFLLLERAHTLAEGAGAAPLAALLEHPELAKDGPVVLVISGGNLDPFLLDRILFIGLSSEGRILSLRATLRDRPGRLVEFLSVAAEAGANVRHIQHDREASGRLPGEVRVEVELEVRDPAHADDVVRAYQGAGFDVERLEVKERESVS